MTHDEENPKEGILGKLLSNGGDSTVKLITLALVVVSGGGNLLATKQTASTTDQEIARATQEIHELYTELKASMDRQKQMQQSLDKLSH